MLKIENKSLQRYEISYGGGGTIYMGRTFEELKNYTCI